MVGGMMLMAIFRYKDLYVASTVTFRWDAQTEVYK